MVKHEVYKMSIWEGYSVFKINVFACWFKRHSWRRSCVYTGKPEAVQRADGRMWANHSVLNLTLLSALEAWVSGVCSSSQSRTGCGRMRQEDYQEFKVILAIYWVPGQPGLQSEALPSPVHANLSVYTIKSLWLRCLFPQMTASYTLFYFSPPWNTYWGAFYTSADMSASSPLRAAWYFTIDTAELKMSSTD